MNVQSPRFALFDSLRGMAALGVVGVHIAFAEGAITKPGYGPYLAQLAIGVNIFFLVSGFLLYRPFVAARFAGARMPSVRAYGIRRFFRIVPTYWVALAVVALWLPLTAVRADPLTYFGFAQSYNYGSLIHGYGPAWTLCVEVVFYVALPIWAFAMRRLPGGSTRRLVAGELAGLILVFAFAVAWNNAHAHVVQGFIPFTPALATLPAYLDQLGLGMALAVASVALADRTTQPSVVRLVHRASWVPWLVAAGGWIALVHMSARAQAGRHVLSGIIAFLLLLPAVFGDDRGGGVRRFLADRRIQWVGLVSYSFYLWHSAILDKLKQAGVDGPVGWLGLTLICYALSLAVAGGSFYLVERPGLRLGRRLAGRAGYQEPDPPPPGAVDRPGAPSIELAGADRPAP